MARHCLYQLVDPREGEAIFWASFIEISEVNTEPPLSILLLHEDRIGEPIEVNVSRMKPTRSRQSTSSLMARLRSSFILLGFCYASFVFALMESLWQKILGSISGISVGAHANTSKLSYKNFLNKVFS